MKQWRFFHPVEVDGLDPFFVSILDVARNLSGVPYKILSTNKIGTSCNEKISHGRGLAVDILAQNDRARFKILSGLFHAGIRRIGITPKYIHVDYDYNSNQDLAWIFTEK